MWDAIRVVLVWCFLAALYIGLPAGWIWNIAKLASNHEDVGMVVLRAIGIFVAPLGGIVGYL